jgi:hypothetical protein
MSYGTRLTAASPTYDAQRDLTIASFAANWITRDIHL